jgi:hypothetical protein
VPSTVEPLTLVSSLTLAVGLSWLAIASLYAARPRADWKRAVTSRQRRVALQVLGIALLVGSLVALSHESTLAVGSVVAVALWSLVLTLETLLGALSKRVFGLSLAVALIVTIGAMAA